MGLTRLALLGTNAQGPWVSTGDLSRPGLRVCGLGDGAIEVEYSTGEREIVRGDGDHFLAYAPSTRLRVVRGAYESVICRIVNMKEALASA